MRLHTESRLGIGALLALQLATSFAAIGLLARVSPAVERILLDNVRSVEAAEQMLAALALPEEDAGARFEAALGAARANVTEAEELPLLEDLDRLGPAALAGDPTARRQAVAALEALSLVNRRSMQQADDEARFLGQAGAWTSALAGMAGFVLSLVVYDRTRRRMVLPVQELHATLAAARQGDHLRRCTHTEGPVETVRIADDLNWLLEQLGQTRRPKPGMTGLRPHLLALLERQPGPTLVLDARGEALALNQAALDRIAAGDRPWELGRALVEGRPLPAGWTASRGAEGWICAWSPAPTAPVTAAAGEAAAAAPAADPPAP